jgi:hypothetical protein
MHVLFKATRNTIPTIIAEIISHTIPKPKRKSENSGLTLFSFSFFGEVGNGLGASI